MGKKSTIELNGKRYDAVTGAFLGKARSAATMTMDFRRPVHSSIGRSIDGTSRTVFNQLKPKDAVNKISQTKAVKSVSRAINSAGSFNSVISNHKPQPPKTLMRRAVHKPQFDMKPSVKVQTPVDSGVNALSRIPAKLSVGQVSPVRRERARLTAKNDQVNRFGSVEQSAASQKAAVQTESANAIRADNQDEDIFESAIAAATSHEQKAPKLKKHRSPMQKVLNGLAILSACLVIGVFVAYLNMPNIELHFASVKAGFHATLPSYKDLGFSLNGPIKASNGIVQMSFASGNTRFTLTQQSSNWDNQTLLESTTYQTDTPPKTVQSDGRTIYISQGNHAAWVSGGIKYNLTGNNNLNPQQITSIADSM